jgi:hypothetical protein
VLSRNYPAAVKWKELLQGRRPGGAWQVRSLDRETTQEMINLNKK